MADGYRPPPAQAQAQPAQAHAQAQERPPPPPLRYEEGAGFGGGLVTPVIFSVKVLTLPITLLEKFCTPPTTEAAKSAPGSARLPDPLNVGVTVFAPPVDGR
jgi:hypothetical protein